MHEGFGKGDRQHTFFDVRIFKPLAKSHLYQRLETVFTSHENEKNRHYNQQIIEVEHGSFNPLFSSFKFIKD